MRSPADIIATGAWITPAERADLVGRIAELDAEVERLKGYMRPDQIEEAGTVKGLLVKLAEAQAQVEALYSEEPCPKCGYGVTGACYGCALKEVQAESAGRLKVLQEKAAEAKAEWLRAEQAEAKLAESESIRADQAIKRGIAEAKLARVVELGNCLRLHTANLLDPGALLAVKKWDAALAAVKEKP